MVLDGPIPIIELEELDQEGKGTVLTPDEEETALNITRKTLNATLKSFAEDLGPPSKRVRLGGPGPIPAPSHFMGSSTP